MPPDLPVKGDQGGKLTANIYLVGVGGQGIITASRIIGDAAILAGKNVLLSETHGMAQRGGTVVCTARIGDFYSPLIPPDAVDVILSFELLECMRAACYASKKTIVISSKEKIVPLSVSVQKLTYPAIEDVEKEVLRLAKEFIAIDAIKMADEAGSRLSTNIVMVGALAGTGVTDLDKEDYEKAIGMNVPSKLHENLAAFRKGFSVTSRKTL